jgi:hypothetical protein
MRNATRSGSGRPDDPWDAESWLRFLFEWETDWHFPGGLSFCDFKRRFLLAIVPRGWIKIGYGGTPGKRGDIGRGHASFVKLYLSGALKKPNRKAFGRLGLEVVSAATGTYLNYLLPCTTGSNIALVGSDRPTVSGEVDPEFNDDFGQASRDWRSCAQLGQPLFQPANRLEFMTLTVILEDGAPCYKVRDVRKMIERKFGCNIDSRRLDKTLRRLEIKRPAYPPS